MSSRGIDGFTKLNNITSIYRPSQQEIRTEFSGAHDNGPSLIVLCSWVSAAHKHIAKYTSQYQGLFPHATILLLESTLGAMFEGISTRADLTPACDVIQAHVQQASPASSQKGANVVLHMFSNGGGNNASQLAKLLQDKYGQQPFDIIVLDSCPGRAEVKSGTTAVMLSLPDTFMLRVSGWEDLISRERRLLNDSALFPKKTPRLYLYSYADPLVNHHHVHEHAEAAKNGGGRVWETTFEKAPHCAMVNEDPERYWSTIKARIAEG